MPTFGELIQDGQYVTVKACQDCTFIIVNGDSPEGFWESDRGDKALDVLSRYDVTPGHMHSNSPDSREVCFHAGSECDDDCDCERTEFSSTPCGICGDTDAGYRHDMVLVLETKLQQF